MKTIFTTMAALSLAGVASAGVLGTGTSNTFADSTSQGDAPDAANTPGSGVTAQFRTSGIVEPTTGTRFINAQNTGSADFDSWASIRWDLTDFYTQINDEVASTPGATGFEIKSVTLNLTQSPFNFSGATDVEGFYVADDSTNFNPFDVGGQFGASGGPDVDPGFFTGGITSAATWFYDDQGGIDSIDISSAEILADLNDAGDNFLTFAFEATGSGNAAYRGMSSPFEGANAPEIVADYNIIPAPGAAALFGFAGLAATRRRR